jgi:hypothetical protein
MLLLPQAFQVGVNLRDLRVGDLRTRKRRHQPDALAHDRHQFRQIRLERHQGRSLSAARAGSMARFAHSRKHDLARITLVRTCARHENGAHQDYREIQN